MPEPNGRSSLSTADTRNEPLNAVIAYGSTRGSTAKIGEAIAEGMTAAGASASAIRLDLLGMMPGRLQAAEVIGIGSPVYFLREATYVTDFISGLDALDGKKAFVYCCCGMDRVGETLQRLEAALSERGATVVGAERFRAAMSYLPYRKRGLGNPDHLPDDSVVQAARDFGERMAGARELGPVALPTVSRATRMKAQLLASRSLRRAVFPGIKLNRELCTGYGSCLSRCPFHGLEREDDEEIPDVTDSCVQCLLCIDSCPRAAIEVDSRVKEWISTLSYRLGLH